MGFPDDLTQFSSSISGDGNVKMSNCVLDFNPNDSSPIPSAGYIPIFTGTSSRTFNWNDYKAELGTSRLGRVVIHTETARTTTDFVTGPIFLHDGLAVIADRQTEGQGRSGNVWLSPLGNFIWLRGVLESCMEKDYFHFSKRYSQLLESDCLRDKQLTEKYFNPCSNIFKHCWKLLWEINGFPSFIY